jgi:methylmalonyl-CoA/ethylmalonyl-CoA epimerase
MVGERMLTRVHHVGLVVRRLEDGLAMWRDVLGLEVSAQATIEDQGVKAALLPIGRSEIELLEPINPDGGVAKFLDKRGEGLHHVCFETPDVGGELAAARAAGLPLIDQAPRKGLAGMICFLHPKGTRGVLTELATPPPGAPHHGPCGKGALRGLALREVTSRSRDPRAAADVFHGKLGLATADAAAPPGAIVAAVEVGGVRLSFLGDDPASSGGEAAVLRAELDRGGEGIAGLVLEIPDPAAAEAALAPLGPRGDGAGIVLDPVRCHGVPLRIARAG